MFSLSLSLSFRHILTVDRRNDSVFPSLGTLLKLSQEFAGLGGDVGFFKNELELQSNVPILGQDNLTLQGRNSIRHCQVPYSRIYV